MKKLPAFKPALGKCNFIFITLKINIKSASSQLHKPHMHYYDIWGKLFLKEDWERKN